MSIGGFRAIDRAREWRRIELTWESAAGVVYPTSRTLLIYAELSAGLEAAGTPLPVNDLWIAAVALEWKLPLLHNDKHFALVTGLRSVTRGNHRPSDPTKHTSQAGTTYAKDEPT